LPPQYDPAVVRQFVGPRGDPDRYELVEMLATDASGNEHWYASRWQRGVHVPYRVGIARHLDPALLDVVGIGPDLAPPDGERDWVLAESFTGPPPHAWEGADAAPLTWYQVWAAAGAPVASARAAPATPRSPRRAPIDRRTALAGLAVISVVAVVVSSIAIGSGSSGGRYEVGTASTRVAATAAPGTVTVAVPDVTTGPPVTYADPGGDNPGGPDVTNVTVATSSNAITFELTFEGTTAKPTVVYLYIDGDNDRTTGHPPFGPSCAGDLRATGVEHYITAGFASLADTTYVATSDGTCEGWTSDLAGTFERLDGAMRLVVPRASLANVSGEVALKVSAFIEAEPGVLRGPEDVVPDGSSPPFLVDLGR
jgi:hypothetical protein